VDTTLLTGMNLQNFVRKIVNTAQSKGDISADTADVNMRELLVSALEFFIYRELERKSNNFANNNSQYSNVMG